MALSTVTNRITSKDIYIEFLPCSLAPATHIETWAFDSAVDGGTMKVWYNGEDTAAITITGTPATDIIAVNAALDALPNTTAGDLVLSGTDITDMTLTATGVGNGFVRIIQDPDNETTLTQGTPNSNLKLVITVTTQGSDWIRVSGDASSFDWEGSVDVVDVTAISEYEATEIPVKEMVSGSLSLYKVQADSSVVQVQLAMFQGNWGVLRVFPEGKVVGKEVIGLRFLVESFSEDYPDHEKVEQEVSGMRQGAWINVPSSIWRG